MKPTTLFGTLVLLITWSSIGATEAGTYSIQKADNGVEQRITAAQSDDSWPLLFIPKSHKPTDIAAWANGGYRRSWINGGGGGGGFANSRGGGWGNGGGGVFRNW